METSDTSAGFGILVTEKARPIEADLDKCRRQIGAEFNDAAKNDFAGAAATTGALHIQRYEFFILDERSPRLPRRYGYEKIATHRRVDDNCRARINPCPARRLTVSNSGNP